MNYYIESVPAKRSNYDTPSDAKKRYGKYSREGITVHYWNSPDQIAKDSKSHDNIVNYIYNKTEGSVNYVISDYKITEMVDPDNVAWASQSGNPTTISIEFDPHLSDEGYKRGGWIIHQLEERYKKTLTLYPHKHWIPTTCPGNISLERLREEADKFKKGGDMVTKQQLNVLYRFYLERGPDNAGIKRYVGKMQFDDVEKEIVSSPEYKDLITKAKDGRLDAKHHLPLDLRRAYKAPSSKKTIKLNKGIYEV